MQNDKYVYLHKDSDGIVRYVGHGNIDRVTSISKCKRSAGWWEIFKDQKPTIEVVASRVSYEEAIALEEELILKYSDTICNKRLPTKEHNLDFEVMSEWFYVDSTSPTGLRWKKQRPRSARRAGDIAGSLLTKESGKKYWQIKVFKTVYKVHRIVYLLATGSINNRLVIDYIDGDGLNNGIENLRLVTQFENSHNKQMLPSKEFSVENVQESRRKYYGSFQFRGEILNFNVTKCHYSSDEEALAAISRMIEDKRKELISEYFSRKETNG